MPRYLALQLNHEEAHLLVATTKGASAVVEHAFTVPLRGDALHHQDAPKEVDTKEAETKTAEAQETEAKKTEEKSSPGQQITAALAQRGIARVETLVTIGRADVELRQLTLPPSPDDELPDMVRIQATREFHSLDDNWPLDYIPLEDRADQPRVVLAAAVDPRHIARIQQTCEAAGLKPLRLTLRPCATASLLNRQQPERLAQVRLLIDLTEDGADLAVLADGKVVFLRAARLSSNPLNNADAVQSLVGEIRRTQTAVENQSGGRSIEAVVLCGTSTAEESLRKQIQSALQLPCEVFNPFSDVKLTGDLRHILPDHAARYAPLLGMIVNEATQTPQAIDFLNPRRRPPPPNRRKQYLIAGCVAVALVVAWLVWAWFDHRWYEQEVVRLNREIAQIKPQAERASKITQIAMEVGKWAGNDMIWLDELHGLCQQFPSAKDAMLTQLVADVSSGTSASSGPRIELQGLVRSPNALDALENRLRQGSHQVRPGGLTTDSSRRGYAYHFKSTILLEKPDAKQQGKENLKQKAPEQQGVKDLKQKAPEQLDAKGSKRPEKLVPSHPEKAEKAGDSH